MPDAYYVLTFDFLNLNWILADAPEILYFIVVPKERLN